MSHMSIRYLDGTTAACYTTTDTGLAGLRLLFSDPSRGVGFRWPTPLCIMSSRALAATRMHSWTKLIHDPAGFCSSRRFRVRVWAFGV